MGAVWRKKWWWLVVLLILAMLALAHASRQERESLSIPERAVRVLYSYLQTGMSQVDSALENVSFYFSTKSRLENDNRRLQREIERLKFENQQLKEYRQEALRLQQILGFHDYSPQYDLIGARVIGRSPGYWNETIFIDRGTRDGLKRNMAVITPEGLIGRIINLHPNSSEVLLITNRQSGVGTVVQQSRAPGIVNGLGNDSYLVMNNIPYYVKIYPDDEVVTSGLSSVFPPGIPVGRVVDVKTDQNGLTRSARLEPAADLGRLEEVLVVVGYHPLAVPKRMEPQTEENNTGRLPQE